MKCRRFNGYMPRVNEIWSSEVLNVPLNSGRGPDLEDDEKVLEVKFTLENPSDGKPTSWTVQEHQMAYGSLGKPAFWALGFYRMDCSVASVRVAQLDRLNDFVSRRSLWIVPWDWMKQFPVSVSRGRTDYSEWNNPLRYPKTRCIPQVRSAYSVKGGVVYFTDGVDESLFDVRGRKIRRPGKAVSGVS